MKKRCGRCKRNKDITEFNRCQHGTLGLHGHCRACQKKVKRAYYLLHRQEEIQHACEYSRSEKAKSARKKRYETHHAVILEANRIRRRTPYARRKARLARRKLMAKDIGFRLTVNLRTRIRKVLVGVNKSQHTMDLLGCTIQYFKTHLASLFQPGMTWGNYGYYGWHVDHIIPCSSFDMNDPQQQARCFHYSNLQPLWRKDNQSKGGTHP